MSVKYKLYEISDNINNTPKKGFIPKVISSGTMDLEKLAKYIAESSSLSEGDIYSVMINMRKTIISMLKMGFNVKIDDLGTFYITAENNEKDINEKVRADNISFKRLVFRTSRSLTAELKNIKFEPVKEKK